MGSRRAGYGAILFWHHVCVTVEELVQDCKTMLTVSMAVENAERAMMYNAMQWRMMQLSQIMPTLAVHA